jgi:hypothetical protein
MPHAAAKWDGSTGGFEFRHALRKYSATAIRAEN